MIKIDKLVKKNETQIKQVHFVMTQRLHERKKTNGRRVSLYCFLYQLRCDKVDVRGNKY